MKCMCKWSTPGHQQIDKYKSISEAFCLNWACIEQTQLGKMVRGSIYNGSVDFSCFEQIFWGMLHKCGFFPFLRTVTGTWISYLWSKTWTQHLIFFRGFMLIVKDLTVPSQMLSVTHSCAKGIILQAPGSLCQRAVSSPRSLLKLCIG